MQQHRVGFGYKRTFATKQLLSFLRALKAAGDLPSEPHLSLQQKYPLYWNLRFAI